MLTTDPEYTPTNLSPTILPTRIPNKPVLRIPYDDPRNNYSYLSKLSSPYEIVYDEEDTVDEDHYVEIDPLDSSSEAVDPSSILNLVGKNISSTDTNLMNDNSVPTLLPPTNLSVSASSYRIQDGSSNSDGSVRWIATLSFDSVIGAYDYEYTITAVES